ncbi:unnamed protein product [Callosobruchus maculatus]|uniref:Uncharacterized protein n=1 Tax=Callosobruchus maculatus TaxID=64391 RepID=A0A653D7L6_CALMS|nr:unnamed protein product [Callosobruchus maculatus]
MNFEMSSVQKLLLCMDLFNEIYQLHEAHIQNTICYIQQTKSGNFKLEHVSVKI